METEKIQKANRKAMPKFIAVCGVTVEDVFYLKEEEEKRRMSTKRKLNNRTERLCRSLSSS